MALVFVGSAMCVRMSRHIQVDFLYRYLPPGVGRVLATFVDLVRIAFFTYGADPHLAVHDASSPTRR